MIVARARPQLRWKKKSRDALPTEPGAAYEPIEGYYIWLGDDEQPTRSWDAVYAQRLAFLAHHPGFGHDVQALQSGEPQQDAIVSAAAKWQITEPDLRAYIEDRDELDSFGDKIFVALRPTEFVVHIPRPLTSARREAVKRWMTDTHRWPHLHEWSDGAEWHEEQHAHLAPDLVARLEWYDRWQAGERPRDILESLPVEIAGETPEEVIRNALQRIHQQLERISPEGLKSPGP